MKRLNRTVGLLRGINVGGNKKVPMDVLRTVAEGCGFQNVRSYIQSGNLVLDAPCDTAEVEVKLERAIEKRFGFPVEVIARDAASWKKYLAAGIYPDAAEARPNFLHLAVSKAKPQKDAAAQLAAKATLGERIQIAGDAIWIDFKGGVGKSKLTPAVLDRAVGSTVTARNWKTILALAELISGG